MQYLPFLNIELLLIGFGIGLLGVLPVGPINIMCISRSLHKGLAAGLATGVGGLAADILFASAALFGVQAIVSFITTYHMILQTLGGTVLILIGAMLMRSKAEFRDEDSRPASGVVRMGVGAFLITITNPAPLFYFASAFSGLGGALSGSNGLTNAFNLLAGVLLGAGSWWVLLASGVSYFRDNFSLKWMSRINLFSGGLLVMFGAIILADYALGLDIIKRFV